MTKDTLREKLHEVVRKHSETVTGTGEIVLSYVDFTNDIHDIILQEKKALLEEVSKRFNKRRPPDYTDEIIDELKKELEEEL